MTVDIKTKQGEIREGIAIRLHTQERSLLRVVEETSPCNCRWEDLSEHFKNQYRSVANSFMTYLHSQELVLKEKCPDCEWSKFGDEVVGMTPCYSCNSTGYVYKPLVE